MDLHKRTLIAIILSVIILSAYQKLYVIPYAKKAQQKKPIPQQVVKADNNRIITVSSDESISIIENNAIKIEIVDSGAFVKQIWAKKFKDTTTNEPIPLVGQNIAGPFLLEEIPQGWELVEKNKERAVYSFKRPEGLVIIKEIFLHNSNYGIVLRIKFHNNTATEKQAQYKLIGASSLFVKSRADGMFIGADIKIGQDITRFALQKQLFQKYLNGDKIYSAAPAWMSIRGRHFLLAFEPKQQEQACFIEKEVKAGARSGILIGPIKIMPQEAIVKEFLLYAGPNDIDEIKKAAPPMAEAITFGKLTAISMLLHKVLKFFYSIFHNYGMAVIFLTLALNIIILPLTRKSMKAMKAMQVIQPEIEKLRQEYKNKPEKLNKEIMELYKKHKVNPLGGCLPTIAQSPIMIALYLVLMKSVELKGARFLWIKDLSEPDAAFKLSTTLPVIGSYINILPILIIIAMIFQQKMSQPQTMQPEAQRMMGMLMPVVFGMLFYNLPSSFVLSWLVNTTTMLIVQGYAKLHV